MKKVNTIFKNSGIGKTAAICQIKDSLSLKQNSVRTICVYHYYRFLTEYCKYDKVYIMTNVPVLDKSLWKCTNILKDLPLIYGTSEKDILNKYDVTDVFMQQSSQNFYGGTCQSQYPFNINRITEWWVKHHNIGGNLYYIQDDPLFPDVNVASKANNRLFNLKNTYCIPSKTFPQELLDIELAQIEKTIDLISTAMKDSIVAFCGIDYNKFISGLKEKNIPEASKWDNFLCYSWQGVNDNIENKLKDFDWENKKYDSEYHGLTKSSKRTKVTEEYYAALKNPFLHVVGRSPFFKHLKEGKDFIKHDIMEYYDLLQYIAANSKSAFVTHEDSILGNQISPRYFDCMLSDIICFVDLRYDPNKNLTDNEELKEFMYVSSPKEFSEKVDKIANDKEYYKHIKYLQRKSIYDNFNEFMSEENKNIFRKKLKL